LYCLKPGYFYQDVLHEAILNLVAHIVPLAAATKSSGNMEKARSEKSRANKLEAFVISNFWIGFRLNRSISGRPMKISPFPLAIEQDSHWPSGPLHMVLIYICRNGIARSRMFHPSIARCPVLREHRPDEKIRKRKK